MAGVTHVLHLATSKETPESIMDVAVKGMFWLLEACRAAPTFQQFILIGGDAGMGHFFYPHPIPVTETQKHSAYPGCYALSKVLEEVMLEQYYIQYDLNGCCLRAPWIMEKDDFKYQLSFGDDVFGGPRWRDLVGAEKADRYVEKGAVPVMLDPDGRPVKRNFVHVDDLVDAILLAIDHPKARQQTFNVCMDEPVDYGALGAYLAASRGLPRRCPFARRTTRPGSTTPRPSSCSVGARATTSRRWWRPPGATRARPTSRGRCGTPGDVDSGSGAPGRAQLSGSVRRGTALAGRGAWAGQPHRRAHRLQRRLRAAHGDRSTRRDRRRAGRVAGGRVGCASTATRSRRRSTFRSAAP